MKLLKCLFVTDLHGEKNRYKSLFKVILSEKPDGVFIGGDILPGGFGYNGDIDEFITNYLLKKISEIKKHQKDISFFIILGNDDPRIYEHYFITADRNKLIHYIHNTATSFGSLYVVGYSYIPPSPFRLKDWEKYDVSKYVDVGAISPEDGARSIDISEDEIRYSTIKDDLKELSKKTPVEKTIYLFHSPPYKTLLDRTALDGKKIDYAPLDVHTGSIAIKRFILKKQPFLTLHGHIHESTRITGCWKEQFGKTYSFNGSHDGSELAIVRFDTDDLENATRVFI